MWILLSLSSRGKTAQQKSVINIIKYFLKTNSHLVAKTFAGNLNVENHSIDAVGLKAEKKLNLMYMRNIRYRLEIILTPLSKKES